MIDTITSKVIHLMLKLIKSTESDSVSNDPKS
jgi:hypothetical protein